MVDNKNIKSRVQEEFAANAQGYVTSSHHAKGEELNTLVEFADVDADSVVLDVATGGGHTALKFARRVKRVVASDLTQNMLNAARDFIMPQVDNVEFRLADAEDLPFEDASFDAVTCRIAAHHFPDVFQFVREAARVLKPGGVLVVEDQLVPDDERDARYIDAFERLRDPSHVRILSSIEWRGNLLDAGLDIEHETRVQHPANFWNWVDRQGMTTEITEKLTVMLKQAPDGVKAWLQPTAIGTPEAAFVHRYIIISGRKPAD